MLRFHTVEKYSLNTDRQFSGARQFVHQVDLVYPGCNPVKDLHEKLLQCICALFQSPIRIEVQKSMIIDYVA